jgi:hypothetical protein
MILFADSFDHYSFTLQKWDATRNNDLGETHGGAPRFGTGGWHGSRRWARKALGGNYATVFMGAAVRFDAATADSAQEFTIFNLWDGGTGQVELRYRPSTAAFRAMRGEAGAATQIQTYAVALPLVVWHYIEWKVTIHNTLGVSVIRVNGVELVNSTGLDTQMSGNAYANQFYIGWPDGTFGNFNIDDVVVLETTDSGIPGAPNNNFLGDVRVESIFPNGNGNSSQWDGSDGNSTDNYLLVDETAPNDDTDYVQSGTIGEKDTYAYGNLTAALGSVYGAQILPRAKKTDAGSRTIVGVSRLSGTEEDTSAFGLSTSYQYFRHIYEGDPSGAQWTIPNINAAEFGEKTDT